MTETTETKDILDCLADLSSDEVFTPPELVNKMLDLLPSKLFEDPNSRFLDPCCKSGVFLREIVKRLNKGLAKLDAYKDLNNRINHILEKQVFGISTTRLTSLISRRTLYCSKTPNGKYSVTNGFQNNDQGNIIWERKDHTWNAKGSCTFCGAPKSIYGNEEGKENYAYLFIHTKKPEELFNMKFDVIIGNPPYQLNDGGGTGQSSTAIYNLFVDNAKALLPRYLVMIIPARWYSGGKGREITNFRAEMLKDRRIRKLVDFENFRDVFPGVDLAGGACYFLWDRDNPGICEVTNYSKTGTSSVKDRYLGDYDVFIRSNASEPIVKKIKDLGYERYLSQRVLPRLPFGIPTTYKPQDSGVPCYFTQREGIRFVRKQDIDDKKNILAKWKFIVPKAPIAGQTDFTKPVAFFYTGNTRIAKPNEVCSESWLVLGAFDSEDEAISFRSYIFTKVVRFLLLQTVVSQNITAKNFEFIPDLLKYDRIFTDEYLCHLWGISPSEWDFIKSKIGEIEENKKQ